MNTGPIRTRHIHVIDDDEVHRMFVVRALGAAGYEVTEAPDGEQALADLGAARSDLVLLDVRMPGVSGLDVCRRIRSTPSLSSIPVLMLTALDGAEDVVAGIEAGADEFVSKPVDAEVLRARVHALLRAKERHESGVPDGTQFPQLLESRIEHLADSARLTKREREVLGLLLLGRTAEDMAVALDITERTARFHSSNVMDKIGADNRMDLFRILLSH